MEFHNRNGQKPSAVLAPPMTNQKYLLSNSRNAIPVGASKIRYSGRGNYAGFYLENNTADRRRWRYPRTGSMQNHIFSDVPGKFKTQVDAARARNLAALVSTRTKSRKNFQCMRSREDLKIMRPMNKTSLFDYTRRNLRSIPNVDEAGFRGVTMAPQYNRRWQARLGKGAAFSGNTYIGTFDTEVDAARAYDVTALLLKGSASQTNFHKESYDGKGILEILRSKKRSFNVKVLDVLERRWGEHFGDQWKGSSGTEGRSTVNVPVRISRSFQQCGLFGSSSKSAAPVADNKAPNLTTKINIRTTPIRVAPYDFRSLMTNDKNVADRESTNAKSMSSQLLQTVARPVSNLYENQRNVKLPQYHGLKFNQLVHGSNQNPGLLSFHKLQNPNYFQGHQNLTSLQGHQYPKLHDDDSTGSNEPIGFDADLQGTGESRLQGKRAPPRNFPLCESPPIMEFDTRPPLVDVKFQTVSNSNKLDIYQSKPSSLRRFSNKAEDPVHEPNPTMGYQLDNQFETNASELVNDIWFQDAFQPVVETDPTGADHFGKLVEPKASEILSDSMFLETSKIMNVDEVLATMETDKCFNCPAGVGNNTEANEGSTQGDLAAASTAAHLELMDYLALMDDPEFNKWLESVKF